MQLTTIPVNELIEQLLHLGVTPGSILLVHCAFSRVRPVENGPLGLIAALQTAVGPEGTLVMPSMSDDTDQPFDPQRTPCLDMGIVAHTFWQLPEVRRSDGAPLEGHSTQRKVSHLSRNGRGRFVDNRHRFGKSRCGVIEGAAR